MLNIRGYRAEVLLPSSGCSWPPQARMPVLNMGNANGRQAIYSRLLTSRLQLFSHAHLTKNSCRGKGHCCKPTSLSNALKLFSQPAPIQQTRVVRNFPPRLKRRDSSVKSCGYLRLRSGRSPRLSRKRLLPGFCVALLPLREPENYL